MRVPSILATVGSAWLCARIARMWLDADCARWCVPFYLGTAMVLEIGGRLQLDPTLAFLCLAAIALLVDETGDRRALVRRTLLAGLACGLGALAKGPVAWVPVGFALVAWACLPRALRFALSRPLLAWIGFALLAILPVATWAALAIHREPALLKPLLFGQHLGRITEGAQHPGPIWDHLRSMPLLLLPWTFLVAAGLWRAWSAWRARSSPGFVRIAVWFLVVFAFFSIIPTKRDLYLLPIYPAAAVLAAFEFTTRVRARSLPRWIGFASAGISLVAGVALACAPFITPLVARSLTKAIDEDTDVAALAALVVPSGILLVVASILALVAFVRSRPKLWCDAIGIGMAAALTAAAFTLIPVIDEAKSARQLAALVRARPEKPSRLPCVGVRPEGVRFYGGGPAVNEALATALAREGEQFLGLCSEGEFERLPVDEQRRFRTLDRGRLGGRTVFVLGRASP